MWAEHHEKELYFTTAEVEKKQGKTLIRNIEKIPQNFPFGFTSLRIKVYETKITKM